VTATDDVRPPRSPLFWWPLSHHRPRQAERCLLLPLGGGRRLALCARCLGLYPTLLGALALQAAAGSGARGTHDWWLTLPGCVPALLDWGLSWLGRHRGTNLVRVGSGILLGLALGRGLWLYLRDPRSEVFWVQLGLLAAGALAFELVRRLHL
jgi:uncharacterized membrane protein